MTDKLLFRSSPGLRRAVTMLTFALLLSSGCASNGTERPATSGMGEIDRFAESFSDDRSEYVFRILLGELAGRRGMADVAFEQYLVLSQALDDPLVSERAVRIGEQATRDQLALGAKPGIKARARDRVFS